MAKLASLVFVLLSALPHYAEAASKAQKKPEQQTPGSKAERVWVIKPDGQKQCGMETPQAPEAGAEQLRAAGIKVLETRKGSDGMMHIQMCGADSGTVNGYLIEKAALAEAIRLGFREAPPGFAKTP